MSVVTANWELPVYQVIGPVIRVHWGYTSHQSDEEWGEPYTIWEAQEAAVPLDADRATFVAIVNEAGGDGEALAGLPYVEGAPTFPAPEDFDDSV